MIEMVFDLATGMTGLALRIIPTSSITFIYFNLVCFPRLTHKDSSFLLAHAPLLKEEQSVS